MDFNRIKPSKYANIRLWQVSVSYSIPIFCTSGCILRENSFFRFLRLAALQSLWTIDINDHLPTNWKATSIWFNYRILWKQKTFSVKITSTSSANNSRELRLGFFIHPIVWANPADCSVANKGRGRSQHFSNNSRIFFGNITVAKRGIVFFYQARFNQQQVGLFKM